MTVQELIDELSKHPSDAVVVLSKDGEGNGFSPLAETEDCLYDAETTWSGTVYEPSDAPGGTVPAVVLWPVN